MERKLLLTVFFVVLLFPVTLWAQGSSKISVAFKNVKLGQAFNISYENAPEGASIVVFTSEISSPATSVDIAAGNGTAKLTISEENGVHCYFAQMTKNGAALSNKVHFAGSNAVGDMVIKLTRHVYPLGQPVDFTYENAPACSKDWIGVYNSSRSPGNGGSTFWNYITEGVNSGDFIVDRSNTAGADYYRLYYLFEDGFYEYMDAPIVYAVGHPAVLKTEDTYISPSHRIILNYYDLGGQKDAWLGVFKKNDDPETSTPILKRPVDATVNGADTIAGGTLEEGVYSVYAFFDASQEPVSDNVDITITAAAEKPPHLTCDVRRMRLGSTVTFNYTNAPEGAHISVYSKGTSFNLPVAICHTTGENGSTSVKIPDNLQNGTLYAAMYTSNGNDSAVVSNDVYFLADDIGGGFTLKSRQFVYGRNQPVFLEYTNAPACPKDWFGIYPVGYDPMTPSTDPGWQGSSAWAYVNGPDAISTFNSPDWDGYFAVFYLLEDKYQYFADPIYFAVGHPASVKPDKTVYSTGEPITLTVNKMSSVRTDWVGIYRQSAIPGTDEPIYRFESEGKIDTTYHIPAGLQNGNYKAACFYAGSNENSSFLSNFSVENKLWRLVETAEGVCDSTKTYVINTDAPLITEADDYDPTANQIYSNAKEQSDATSYGNLIDGDPVTYFYTCWTNGPDADHFIQIDLKENPVESFKFKYVTADYPGGYGQRDRWKDITVYATNDTADNSSWKEIRRIDNLPTDESVKSYYSPGISLGESYRYIRLTVRHTVGEAKHNGHVYSIIGDFQMYKATLDETNSLVNYDPAVKSAVKNLKQWMKKANDEISAGNETEETYNGLLAAVNTVRGLIPDTLTASKKMAEAKALVDEIKVGEKYGDVNQEQYDAFIAAVNNAEGYNHVQPTKADLEQHMNILDAALELVQSQRITFELNKWYYITNMDETRTGNPNDIWSTFCYGNAIFAAGNNIQDDNYSSETDAIKWGFYNRDTGELTCLDNPYAMWRIVAVDEAAKTYALQNRGTGTYMGILVNKLGRQGMRANPIPYYITHQGEDAFRIECADESNTQKTPLHAAGDHFVYETEGGYKSASSWTFRPVKNDVDAVYLTLPNNSVQTICLPYAVQDVAANNIDVKAYAVKNMPDANTLELTLKDSFEPGEPFIIIVGDYTKYNVNSGDTVPVIIPAPNEFTVEAKVANGLVGNILSKLPLTKPGLGYFTNALLMATTGGTTFINGHQAYIDPLLITPGTGQMDEKLTSIGQIDGVKTVVVKASDKVNVYSIDGKLLKRNVSAGESMKGLNRGMYIIGKKKVSIK